VLVICKCSFFAFLLLLLLCYIFVVVACCINPLPLLSFANNFLHPIVALALLRCCLLLLAISINCHHHCMQSMFLLFLLLLLLCFASFGNDVIFIPVVAVAIVFAVALLHYCLLLPFQLLAITICK